MWHHLRIRTRILIGYGLVLALIATLGAVLTLRAIAFNAKLSQLSADVRTEVSASARLSSRVAAAQQAIDRYLQQPEPATFQQTGHALDDLAAALADAQAGLADPRQQQRLAALKDEMATYQSIFQALSQLMDSQTARRSAINQRLFDASTALNDALRRYLRTSPADLAALNPLLTAQQQLQLSRLWSTRLMESQAETIARNAVDSLQRVDANLKPNRFRLDATTRAMVDNVLADTAQSAAAIAQYAEELAQVTRLRDSLLSDHGGRLKQQADAIASASLDRLAEVTFEMEQQTRQQQQLTAGALGFTLLIVAVFGVILPRTISRPLMELEAAARQINQGEFTVAVVTQDKSEVGSLATAFNQMAAALHRQRAEIQHQQAALVDQNRHLARALEDLHASTAAREQLAQTVRAMSVPVVPILKQVLLIPLVGEIDAERAQTLLGRLLDGIASQGARIVILDITGVPVVDESLVGWLIEATSAAKLLGAQCVLVGIGPEVAQALVASGANLGQLVTRADLRHAVEYSLRVVAG